MYSSKYTQGRFSYFVTVAETGNITKAAQVLHVSQPSLSQYLTRLERDLGVKLLNRNTTPIALTKAGKIYLEYVRSVLKLEKQLKADLDVVRHNQEQTLTIGVPTQLTPLVFGSCIQSFIDLHPEINVKILEGSTSIATKKLLLEGTVDIAFFHSIGSEEPYLIRRIIQQENLLLATNKNNAIIREKTIPDESNILPLDTSDIPLMNEMQLISLGEDFFLHRLMMDYLTQLGVVPKKIVTVPNVRAIGNYISNAKYNGLSILPNFITSQLQSVDNLVYLKPIGYQTPVWFLTMNAPANQDFPKCVRLFWDSVPSKVDLL